MNKIQKFIEKSLLPVASKIAGQRHLSSLRDGFIYAMPFLIIGSFILLLVNLPLSDPNNFLYQEWYANLMTKYKANLVQPFYVSMGIMSLFVSFGIGYSLANSYNLSGISGGFLSLFSFLIISGQSDWVPLGEGSGVKWGVQEGGWLPIIDARYLDAKGVFTAIIIAFITVELFRFMVKNNITIRLPESVPPAVAKSFEALLPVVLIVLIFQPINIIALETTGFPLPQLILELFKPLLYFGDSLAGVMIIVLIVHLCWFAGIHGSNVILPILNPIILTNLEANQLALEQGEALPHILAGGFLDSYMYLGGSGATLGLAIAMSMSKSKHLSAVGKLSIAPGIFNINEPMMFGTPIILNPIMGIPFILIPLINVVIAYTLTRMDFIQRVVTLVPWTTPSPLAAFISTNLDFLALALSLLLLIFATILYMPFLKIYEKSLMKKQN